MVHNNLGTVCQRQGDRQGARQHYAQALEVRRILATEGPEKYQPELVTTLTNVGSLLDELNDLEQSKTHYREAAGLLNELRKQEPDRYLPELARVLNNLASVQRKKGELEEAQRNYLVSLQIRRALASARPGMYEDVVAATLNNLGNCFGAMRDLGAARRSFEEARDLLRTLADSNPDIYNSPLAVTLNNLATVLTDLKLTEEARKTYEGALDSLYKGAGYKLDYAMACARISSLERADENPELAGRWADRALTRLEGGLAELAVGESEDRHYDTFKARVEPAVEVLIEQYAAGIPAASAELLRLFEWLRRAEATADLKLCQESRGSVPAVHFAGPVLWMQWANQTLYFAVLRPDVKLEVFAREIKEDEWRNQKERALSALLGRDPDEIVDRARALFECFPPEIRSLFLERSDAPIFVSPCRQTMDMPLELIPADEGDPGLPFAGLRRLVVRFHGVTELDRISSAAIPITKVPRVVVGDPTAGTRCALQFAAAGAAYAASLLKTEPQIGNSVNHQSVLESFGNPELGILLYSGHGFPGGLVLADGEVFTFQEQSKIKWRNRPLVHLDCCDAGTVIGTGGGRFLGMPSVMLLSGAGAVLASYQPLYDERAMHFSNYLYDRLIGDGKSLGAALMEARRMSHEKGDNFGSPTFWASSVLWGNPHVRLVVNGEGFSVADRDLVG